MKADYSTHLVNYINKGKVKNPVQKLYKLSLDTFVSKNVVLTRSESTVGPCTKNKEVFKFYDGSALGFFFEGGSPVRVEDYGSITSI